MLTVRLGGFDVQSSYCSNFVKFHIRGQRGSVTTQNYLVIPRVNGGGGLAVVRTYHFFKVQFKACSFQALKLSFLVFNS